MRSESGEEKEGTAWDGWALRVVWFDSALLRLRAGSP